MSTDRVIFYCIFMVVWNLMQSLIKKKRIIVYDKKRFKPKKRRCLLFSLKDINFKNLVIWWFIASWCQCETLCLFFMVTKINKKKRLLFMIKKVLSQRSLIEDWNIFVKEYICSFIERYQFSRNYLLHLYIR